MRDGFRSPAMQAEIKVRGGSAWDEGETAGAPSMAARAVQKAHGGLHHIGGAMQEASAGARP